MPCLSFVHFVLEAAWKAEIPLNDLVKEGKFGRHVQLEKEFVMKCIFWAAMVKDSKVDPLD